jgi:hypothetical protein
MVINVFSYTAYDYSNNIIIFQKSLFTLFISKKPRYGAFIIFAFPTLPLGENLAKENIEYYLFYRKSSFKFLLNFSLVLVS